MKKTLSIMAIASSIALSSQANAGNGVYVGADLLYSNADYQYLDSAGNSATDVVEKRVDGDSFGAGLSVGYKKSFGQAFVAPEIFYDHINSSVEDYYYVTPTYRQDTMEIRNRYGVKANFGYDFNQNISAYVSYGAANINYINRSASIGFTEGKSKLAQIFGIGTSYNINENWSLRAEFNYQDFNARYSVDSSAVTSRIKLSVLKTGLVYNF